MTTLRDIAIRHESRAAMETLEAAEITVEHGVEKDFRGRPGRRQVSILSNVAWEIACNEAGSELPWTTRRANLLVDDMDLGEHTPRLAAFPYKVDQLCRD